MPQSAMAFAIDVGAGYSLLDLSNPDTSTARSSGFGGTLGGYYSICGNQNFDFGLKGSVFYSQMDNDVNTAFLSEKTKYYNAGLGVELSVYNVFASWQYKYNRIDIELEGNIHNTSAYSDYMSQFELGYIFYVNTMQVRLVYQRTDGTLPMADTSLSSDTDFNSNAFMVVLRFDLSPKRASSESYRYGDGDGYKPSEKTYDEKSAPEQPSYRSYRWAPSPSPYIK
jgi:hypothetical protein